MTSRSNEPRRDATASRRGSSRTTGGREAGGPHGEAPDERRLASISDARAYTPRGRTVREAPELRRGRSNAGGGSDAADQQGARGGRSSAGDAQGRRRTPRSNRSADPFRPALQVLDGGRAATARGTRTDGQGSGRTVKQRTGRAADVAKPAPTGRRSATARRATGVRAGATGRPTAAGRMPARRPARPPRPPRLADPRRRLRLGTMLALALFTTIGIRLVVLQVIDTPAYAKGGLIDRLSNPVVLPAPRGAIYDRSGAVLAHSVEARYVYADPEMVEDPAKTADALSPLLGIARSDLLPRLVKQKRPDGRPSRFEWLARGVEIATANKIAALNLAGIEVHRDERREVPGGDLAANLIGFTGRDHTGLQGIEARYDQLLRGVNGERIFEIGKGDLAKEIPGGYSKEKPAQPGSSLQLTIDRDLQYEVQRILSATCQRTGGSTAAAVVIDVRTGEVLAQASHPTYDAANPLDPRTKVADRDDVATGFVVDPGSVHKAIVFGAALEEGVVEPDSTITVAPTIRKGDTTIRDTHPMPAGTKMSLPGILAYSSNVGTIKIADLLGPQRLHDYQLRFGLGRATGEGVPGEAAGRVLDPKDWSGSAYGSIPIGHSVDVTPLQMAAVYAAIANDGRWVQPHLVREIIGPDGTRTPAKAPQTRQVISPANAAALRTMLEAVVTVKDATGRKAAIPGYRVAGKTGTGSQVVDGRYAPGEVASFIGMAPADHPRYVIAVFVHSPSGGGGDVSAPAFKEMMAFTLRHYRVPPTGSKPPPFVVFPR